MTTPHVYRTISFLCALLGGYAAYLTTAEVFTAPSLVLFDASLALVALWVARVAQGEARV